MSQSRLGSLLESAANIAIGLGVGLAAQLVLFPLYGIKVPLQVNAALSVWFTAVSLARSYCVRRWFNTQPMRRLFGG